MRDGFYRKIYKANARIAEIFKSWNQFDASICKMNFTFAKYKLKFDIGKIIPAF